MKAFEGIKNNKNVNLSGYQILLLPYLMPLNSMLKMPGVGKILRPTIEQSSKSMCLYCEVTSFLYLIEMRSRLSNSNYFTQRQVFNTAIQIWTLEGLTLFR